MIFGKTVPFRAEPVQSQCFFRYKERWAGILWIDK